MNTNTVEESKLQKLEEVILSRTDALFIDGTKLLLKDYRDTLTQHHQAELAEVYREILSVRNVDIIYASDIKTIAEKRGIDISDKTDTNA